MTADSIIVNGYFWANLAISSGIMYICICRFSQMTSDTTLPFYRARYVVIFVGAMANGLSRFIFPPEQPGMGTVLMAAALLWHLAASASLWKNGVPEDGCKVVHQRRSSDKAIQ